MTFLKPYRILKFFFLLPLAGFSEECDITKVSEAIGHLIGKNLDAYGLEFDMEAIAKGLKEEAEGKSSPLSEEECAQAISHLQEEKIISKTEENLQQIDTLSNGDQIDEDRPFSAPDSAKYR